MKELTRRGRIETLLATLRRSVAMPKETCETFSDGGFGVGGQMLLAGRGRGNRIDDIEEHARVDFAVSYVRL